MAIVFKDRVREFTRVQGLGSYQLLGPVVGYQAFSVIGDGSQCYYAVTDGIAWETGLGTYALSGNTLARASVEESSNGNAAVNWTAGDKTIWLDFTAIAATAGSGGGSVSSVGLTTPTEFSISGSPVTSAGTLGFSWANQSANAVLAGPSSGSPAAPTFRALAASDLLSALQSLPTSLPGSPNQLWWNGGVLSLS